MAYVEPNYPTKKAFKQAVADGARPKPYNPSGLFPPKENGEETIEGPHYPKPHSWYARVRVEDGEVVKVIG